MRNQQSNVSGRTYYSPNEDYQWLRREVWFQPVLPTTHSHSNVRMYYGNVTSVQETEPATEKDKWESGVLVASGWMPGMDQKLGKHLHWIVNKKSEEDPIRVDQHDILAYRDGGGITDKITDEGLSVLPHDREEIACFYVEWQDSKGQQRITLGHTPFFRLPYEGTPLDYVPEDLRREQDIDFGEAIFGYTKTQGVKKAKAYASRVFVTDATFQEAPNGLWLVDQNITSKILATAKPTCFQHYLVQNEPDLIRVGTRRDGSPRDELRLRHYGSPTPEETVIRGHKLYWPQGQRNVSDIEENDPQWLDNGRVKDSSTQHTQFKPVNQNVTFSFRIYFENLSDKELGALCWVLHPLGDEQIRQDPNRGYCHHLGMGKSLGMGAVRLDAVLHLAKRTDRYRKLFDGTHWATGTSAGERLEKRTPLVAEMTNAFEANILNALRPFKDGKECTRLCDLKRIAMLLKMLEWPGIPPQLPARPQNRVGNTRQMLIQLEQNRQRINEFRYRPVLPDPCAFGELTGNAEPESGKLGVGSSGPNRISGF